MYQYELDERRRQIEELLAYPQVGPLNGAAIAVNLGTDESGVQAALASLLQEGRIVQLDDERFTGTSPLSRGDLVTQEPGGNHGTELAMRNGQ